MQLIFVCIVFLVSMMGSALGFRNWLGKRSEDNRLYSMLLASLALGLVAVLAVIYIMAVLLLVDSVN